MKLDEILIVKTAPGFTAEPSWWRFCVKADGSFEYEKSSWSEKSGESSQIKTGMLSKKELAWVKKIIPTLDEVELDGFIIEDAGSSIIDYRRADKTTGSVERHGEPVDDDGQKDEFDTAWLAIAQIAAAHR
jgi:hypothetical protein